MSYLRLGTTDATTALPADVSSTIVEELSSKRGWVAIPTPDMREYVKSQIMTVAAGFFVGVGIGALLRGGKP